MTIVQFLVIAGLLVCTVVGMIRVLDVVFEHVWDRRERKAYEIVEVGSRWISNRTPDPWSERFEITIIDKRDGWVKYCYEGRTAEWAMKATHLIDGWTRLA